MSPPLASQAISVQVGVSGAWPAHSVGSDRPSAAALADWFWQRVCARLLAGILLLTALPAIVLALVLVRLTSRGAGIHRQVRLGARGRPFVMYKIRTMVADAEARTGPVWTATRDPRITRVGGLLRVLNWDELPQLWNIVKGDMAFVGPRPERPEIAEALAAYIPGYLNRVAVLPGVTGLAQINLSADKQLDDVRKKLQLDLEYVRERGAWLDIRIILATLPRLIGVRSAAVARSLGVWRKMPELSMASMNLLPANDDVELAVLSPRISFVAKQETHDAAAQEPDSPMILSFTVARNHVVGKAAPSQSRAA